MSDFATNHQPSQIVNPPITQPMSQEPYTNPNPVPTNLPPAATGFDPPNPGRSMPTTNSATGGEATKIPNLQSNMFKMQRNRSNYRLHEIIVLSSLQCFFPPFFVCFSVEKVLC